MKISKNCVVAFDYNLTDDEGQCLDSSEGATPLEYLHGKGNIIPGLERELEGREVGDWFKVTVEPKDGYGVYDEDLIDVLDKKDFPEDVQLEVGMQFEAEMDDGVAIVTVTEIDGDKITVDGNHELAGETLTFDVKVLSVRDATPEELAHGHVHGESCGHDHDHG